MNTPPADRASRRGFLGRLLGGLGAAGALPILGGFDAGEPEGRMYGPVRPAEAALRRPAAVDAAALFGDAAQGRVIERQWAIGHLTRGEAGQLVIVLVDGATGGHAELELWARGGDHDAVVRTRRFALHVAGTPGHAAPPHLQRVAARIGVIVRRHEAAAAPLTPPLPARAPSDLA